MQREYEENTKPCRLCIIHAADIAPSIPKPTFEIIRKVATPAQLYKSAPERPVKRVTNTIIQDFSSNPPPLPRAFVLSLLACA